MCIILNLARVVPTATLLPNGLVLPAGGNLGHPNDLIGMGALLYNSHQALGAGVFIDLRWSERFALSTNSLGTLTDRSGFKPDVSVRTLPAQI